LKGERKRRVRVRIASVAAAFALFFAAISQFFSFVGLDERVRPRDDAARPRSALPSRHGAAKSFLAGIDAASERDIGRKFGADWRAEHAKFIANAASAAARSVAFDMVLEDSAPDAANAALEAALKAHAADPRQRADPTAAREKESRWSFVVQKPGARRRWRRRNTRPVRQARAPEHRLPEPRRRSGDRHAACDHSRRNARSEHADAGQQAATLAGGTAPAPAFPIPGVRPRRIHRRPPRPS
jgi:hypothetical protein